jgi:BRCT domain type II-containing protein
MELGIVEILLVILAVLISLSFTLRKVLVFHWGCVREDEEENVEGKIVVITGAGSGLGFETAVEMAKRYFTRITVVKDFTMVE